MANTNSIHHAAGCRNVEQDFERNCARIRDSENGTSVSRVDWSVSVHSCGLELVGTPTRRRCVTPPDTKRGAIFGFSKKSSQRAREKLVGYNYANSFACALTAPDYTGTSPEAALASIRRHKERFGVAHSFWRKEVTRRGRPHFHLIVWPVPGVDACDCFQRLIHAWVDALFVGSTVEGLWQSNALNKYGLDQVCLDDMLRDYPDVLDKTIRSWVSNSGDVLGKARFDALAVNLSKRNFRVFDSNVAYIRYILDHTSKHKDYQARTVGRPWGVMGDPPKDFALPMNLDYKQSVLLLRVLRKASRYRKSCSCVFGHKRAFGKHFSWAHSNGGHYVQFGGFGDRLVDWVRCVTN